ncbi:AAA family ATPase [Sulfitobacter sp. 1A13679]|uniref:AAA family ATPase n=1 Tax=Sulfitobacter sp. 1A13679 TaxID=3368597 RepID=UPI0037477E04
MSVIRFTPVSEITEPLNLAIGLSGGSGTGKTYSALLIARGIAEVVTGRKGAPIGFIDTENRRALHYKAAFPEMVHCDMRADDENGDIVGFGPERWIEYIDAAEAAELPVIVIDSFSHSHEGVGGMLDLHATTLDRLAGDDANQRDKRSQLAWAEVKPRFRRLTDRIIRAKTNIIICTRAKPVMQRGYGNSAKNARPTKLRREDVPWDIAGDASLIFEMTTQIILDPAAPGCPVHQIKVADQFKALLDPRRPMGVETGRAMATWAKGQGDAQAQKELLDAARAIARTGKEKFTAHWQSLDKPQRAIVATIMDELQQLAIEADAVQDVDDEDPFASAKPSAEEMAAAEAEARAAADAQAQEDAA